MNKKLQVFVSSTYTDLKEERQAAVEAILDAGHIPAGMELFKAGNESQLKTIKKWIDESDVYMLILGGRYGSIEEKSGKSYTQLEYEYALSKNIPVFAVILSDSFLSKKINLLTLSNTIEQKSPDKYQSFKSLVMSKIIRMVDDCKDIKMAVYSAINEFNLEYNLTGWTRTLPPKKINKSNNIIISVILNRSPTSQIVYDNLKMIDETLFLFNNITFHYIDTIFESKNYKQTIAESNVIIFDSSKTTDESLFYLGYSEALMKEIILTCHEKSFINLNHILSFINCNYEPILYGSDMVSNFEFTMTLQTILNQLLNH